VGPDATPYLLPDAQILLDSVFFNYSTSRSTSAKPLGQKRPATFPNGDYTYRSELSNAHTESIDQQVSTSIVSSVRFEEHSWSPDEIPKPRSESPAPCVPFQERGMANPSGVGGSTPTYVSEIQCSRDSDLIVIFRYVSLPPKTISRLGKINRGTP